MLLSLSARAARLLLEEGVSLQALKDEVRHEQAAEQPAAPSGRQADLARWRWVFATKKLLARFPDLGRVTPGAPSVAAAHRRKRGTCLAEAIRDKVRGFAHRPARTACLGRAFRPRIGASCTPDTDTSEYAALVEFAATSAARESIPQWSPTPTS